MYRHSEGRNIAILRDLMPHPLMSIHPTTAGKLGIQEGDEVMWKPRGEPWRPGPT